VPFKSKAQQRWMFSQKPATAKRWADHTPNIKALPDRVGNDEKSASSNTEVSMSKIAALAAAAAEAPYVNKLAADSGLNRDEIQHLAGVCRMPLAAFCKNAYADPQAFNELVKLAAPPVPASWLARNKLGVGLGSLGILGGAGAGILSVPFKGKGGPAATPAPGAGLDLGGPPSDVSVSKPDPADAATPNAGNPAGDPAAGGAAAAGGGGGMSPAMQALLATGLIGGGAYLGHRMTRKKREGKTAGDELTGLIPSRPESLAGPQRGALSRLSGMLPQKPEPVDGFLGNSPALAPPPRELSGASGFLPKSLGDITAKLSGQSQSGIVPKPAEGLTSTPTGEGVPAAKAAPGRGMGLLGPLAAALGAGALGYGAYKAVKGRKKKKQASDNQLQRAVKRVILTKVAKYQVKVARDCMDGYLNEVVRLMPLEKRGAVRRLQAEIVSGNQLTKAIKVAFPHLHGEARGILAHELCKAATNYAHKRANEDCGDTKGSASMMGPMKDAGHMFQKMGDDMNAPGAMIGSIAAGGAGYGLGKTMMAPPKPMPNPTARRAGLLTKNQPFPAGKMGGGSGVHGGPRAALKLGGGGGGRAGFLRKLVGYLPGLLGAGGAAMGGLGGSQLGRK